MAREGAIMDSAALLDLTAVAFVVMTTIASAYAFVDWLWLLGDRRYQKTAPLREGETAEDRAGLLLAAEAIIARQSALVVALGFLILLALLVLFPSPPQFQTLRQFAFRGYGLLTAGTLLWFCRAGRSKWHDLVRRQIKRNGKH